MDSHEFIKTKLEPEVSQVVTGGMDAAVAMSIAVSLKRLADAVCGDEQNTGIHRAILDISDKR